MKGRLELEGSSVVDNYAHLWTSNERQSRGMSSEQYHETTAE